MILVTFPKMCNHFGPEDVHILFQFWRMRTLERRGRDQKNLISFWKEDSKTGRKGEGDNTNKLLSITLQEALQLIPTWIWMYFRCLLTGGEQVLDDYLFEQENLIYCMLKQFDLEVNIWCIKCNLVSGVPPSYNGAIWQLSLLASTYFR